MEVAINGPLEKVITASVDQYRRGHAAKASIVLNEVDYSSMEAAAVWSGESTFALGASRWGTQTARVAENMRIP